jgi:hypothetical protein
MAVFAAMWELHIILNFYFCSFSPFFDHEGLMGWQDG